MKQHCSRILILGALLSIIPYIQGCSAFGSGSSWDPFRGTPTSSSDEASILATNSTQTSTPDGEFNEEPILADSSKRIARRKESSPVAIESSDLPEATSVEVIWEVPSKEVEGFVLRYGYSRENLSHEIQLRRDEVESYTDQEFGRVYRYILRDIPSTQPLYLQLANTIGDQTSSFSEVFELRAEKKGPS